MGMLIEGNLHHKKFKRNKIKWNNHSLNRPTSPQLQIGGGGGMEILKCWIIGDVVEKI